jgi:hypothetical protein
MKVVREAPTLRSRRLIVTEHGIPYQVRASWGRSHRSSRRSHDLPGGLGKPVVGRRVTGEPLEPDAATRNAERPKGEKRQLASRMLENKHVRFPRRAEGKGSRERYLASRLSYLGHPLRKSAVVDEGAGFLANACEKRIQSTRSILRRRSDRTPFS